MSYRRVESVEVGMAIEGRPAGVVICVYAGGPRYPAYRRTHHVTTIFGGIKGFVRISHLIYNISVTYLPICSVIMYLGELLTVI